MVEVLVEFDYDAQEPDELTIRKGDVIRNVTIKPGGWWEGSLGEKRGMFPDNFVRLLESDVVLRTKKKRYCEAIYTYEPEHEDELHLNLGDVIEVLGEIEEGWWKGRLNEKEGVFPSNFVEECTGTTRRSKDSLLGENEMHVVPSLPPKPVKTLYQALFDYTAQNEDELTLKVGDLITLISKDGQDKGWWRGELRSRVGVFPDNFVTQFPPPAATVTPQHKKPQGAATRTQKTTPPPIPGKKPIIPIKKSPLGLKPIKNYDNIDGGGLSKPPPSKSEFDQVERGSMLVDMRQNRAKAPGRRPPSMVRENTNELTNGNHEVKAKTREWEKNKVPWMDELKLNQAKKSPNSEMSRSSRTSSSEQLDITRSREQLDEETTKKRSRTSSYEQLDMTRSRTSEQLDEETTKETKKVEESVRLRTPTPDVRPIVSPLRPIVSPIRTPSPKPPPSDRKSIEIPTKSDLEDRVRALEIALDAQAQQFNNKLDDVMKKLQNEIDLRQQLLIQVEKLTQCVTQV